MSWLECVLLLLLLLLLLALAPFVTSNVSEAVDSPASSANIAILSFRVNEFS